MKEYFGHEKVGSIEQKKKDGDAHPQLIACDANMCPEDFKEELLVPKQAYVHRGGRRRCFNLQVQRHKWRVY